MRFWSRESRYSVRAIMLLARSSVRGSLMNTTLFMVCSGA